MKTITTDEAEELLNDDVPFVDVRTEEEFADGHVPGALNIPESFATPGGMTQNPDFVAVVSAQFDRAQTFIVACRSGGRSARAAALLEAAGFTHVLDMTAGFSGKKNAFGEVIPGWQAEGREIEFESTAEQTYALLKADMNS